MLKRIIAAALAVALVWAASPAAYAAPAESPAIAADDSAENTQELKEGDNDYYVGELQKALSEQGYYEGEITGVFDEATTIAVIAYQEANFLTPTGRAGTLTRISLLGDDFSPLPAYRAEFTPLTDYLITAGDRGERVSKAQSRLRALGYYRYEVTSYYGAQTVNAVANFQRLNGLTPTGSVDSKTYDALMSGDAIPITTPAPQPTAAAPDQSERPAAGETPQPSTTYWPWKRQEIMPNSAGYQDPETFFTPKPSKAPAANGGEASPNKAPAATGNDSSRSAAIENMITVAKRYLGRPYVWGGNGPSSFDCSGFTTYVLRQVGKKVPRTAYTQSRMDNYQKIGYEGLKRGDLIFFDTRSSTPIGHVGIALGNNQFIHASSAKKKIVISELTGYYREKFEFGRRVFP